MGGGVSVFPVEASRLRPGAAGTPGTQQHKDNFAGASSGVWAHFLKSPRPAKENRLEKSERVALRTRPGPGGAAAAAPAGRGAESPTP